MIQRLFGAALIFLSAAYIPIIGAIAVNSSFTVAQKGLYSAIIYGASWIILFLGIYMAGPELVKKLKDFYEKIKVKIFKKK
jgi:hypothetical protein